MSRLPDGWSEVPFKDLGAWYGGGTPSKSNSEYWTNGTIPWLSPKDMGADVLKETQDLITRRAVDESSVKLVPAGSVAVVVRSGILERTLPVALVPFEATLNQDMKAVHPKPGILPEWIAWGIRAGGSGLLGSVRKAGTTVASIEIPRFMSSLLPVPPLDEQRRIVAILEDHLGRLDISVESLQRALNYLETFRLALFGSAIRGAVGELRFDGDSWPVATLDELQAPGQGSITDGPFGSNLKSSHYTSSGARVIRLQNIGLGHFLDAEAYISLEHFERLRKHAAIPGDLIVASLGDVLPRVCLLPDLGEPTIVKADCIRVRLGDRVRGRWVLMAMLTQKARQWAREELHGVGRQRLGLKAIRSFEVPVPSVSVQDEILAQVDAVLSRSTSVELAILAALRRSEGVRKSLLSAAFSGQLSRESLVV